MTDFLGTNIWVFCVVDRGEKRTQKEDFMEEDEHGQNRVLPILHL